jgi:integrase
MGKDRGIYESSRKPGEWWIRYVGADRRLHREKAGLKSWALILYRKRKTEALQGRKLPETLKKRTITINDIADDAIKLIEGRGGQAGRVQIVKTWFGGRAADQISAQEIEQELNGLAAAGRAPATINRFRAALSVIYSLAIRNGKVSLNPARLVRLRKENNARVRFLDNDEESALRTKIRELCREREPEFELALHTGMRRGEQYSISWSNVDLDRGVITIPRSKHGEKRHVRLNSVARTALGKLWGRGDSYVCPGGMTKLGYWSRWFEDCVTAAGIVNFRWHDLRHTFASRLVMAGVDLRTVQELMGHKTITMTVRYAHLAKGHLQDAVERLAMAKPTDTRTDTSRPQTSLTHQAEVLQVQ